MSFGVRTVIEPIFVTLLPILFLIVLFGGGEWFHRGNIDMDGEPPINHTLFYISKYSIIVLWGLWFCRAGAKTSHSSLCQHC